MITQQPNADCRSMRHATFLSLKARNFPNITGSTIYGHKCDICGDLFVPRLSTVWVKGKEYEEMSLCIPCIKQIMLEGFKVQAEIESAREIENALMSRTELREAKIIRAEVKARFDLKLQKKEEAFLSGLQEKREKARHNLAEELKCARTRLRALRRMIANEEYEAEKLVAIKAPEVKKQIALFASSIRKEYADRLVSAKKRLAALRAAYQDQSDAFARPAIEQSIEGQYPAVPAAAFIPKKYGYGLPSSPGIYFLWLNDTVEYVGRANKLCDRLNLGGHHVLREDHRISFVLLPIKELTWAECWYIGMLRPKRNFGVSASHYEKPASLPQIHP